MNYNNDKGQGEDDGSLAFLNLPTPDGQKKSFHCDKTTQQKLANRTFWIIDYDKDIKTKFGTDKYLVFVKYDLNDPDDKALKFFTGSSDIKGKLDMIRERNAFPRRVTLRMEGNNYWIEYIKQDKKKVVVPWAACSAVVRTTVRMRVSPT